MLFMLLCSASDVVPVDHGLLSAGEFTKEGTFIDVTNGSLYGKGIYVSPNIKKATDYSYRMCLGGIQQVIVSLVGMGRVFQCESPFYIDKEDHVHYKYGNKTEGYDSHISPDRLEYVLFDKEQLLPVLLVTIGNQGDRNETQHRALERQKEITPIKPTKAPKHPKSGKKPDPVIAMAKEPPIFYFTHVPGSKDDFLIKMDQQDVERTIGFHPSPPVQTQLIFLLPRHKSLTSKHLERYLFPACKDVYDMISPDKANVIFIGKSIEKQAITNSSFFLSPELAKAPPSDRIDILGGHAAAVDIALNCSQKMASKADSVRDEGPLMSLFVLVTVSEDTENDSEAYIKSARESMLVIGASHLNCYMSIIQLGLGDLEGAMQLKFATDTLQSAYFPSNYQITSPAQLPATFVDLGKDLKRLLRQTQSGIPLSVGVDTPFNGFMPALGYPPRCQCTIPMEKEAVGIFYRGIPPQEIHLTWFGSAKLLPRPFTPQDAPFLLHTLQRLIPELKASAIAQRDVSPSLTLARGILSATKETLIGPIVNLNALAPKEKAALITQTRGSISQLETQLNSLEDKILLAQSSRRVDKKAIWLTLTEDMKHGADALRRVERAESSVSSSNILIEFDKLKKSHPALAIYDPTPMAAPSRSSQSQRTAQEHWESIYQTLDSDFDGINVPELLYSLGMVGRGIHVKRSEASNINPWALIVEYVSLQVCDTNSAMCLLDIGLENKDETGKPVEDVLVIPDPARPLLAQRFVATQLHQAYMGVVFARNYELSLPSQHLALTMISFVKAVEQLMSEGMRTHAHLQVVFEMYAHLQDVTRESKYWKAVALNLLSPRPGLFMTEAEEDDVVSVAKVLGPLCFCSPGHH